MAFLAYFLWPAGAIKSLVLAKIRPKSLDKIAKKEYTYPLIIYSPSL